MVIRKLIDDVDKKILNKLIVDARASWTTLAKELGVNESTIRYRVRKLEDSGVIVGYKAKVNYVKAGLTSSLTGIDVEPEHLWSVLNELKQKNEVVQLYLTTGDHVIIAEIIAENKELLERIHNYISSLPGVKRVCPSIVMDIYK